MNSLHEGFSRFDKYDCIRQIKKHEERGAVENLMHELIPTGYFIEESGESQDHEPDFPFLDTIATGVVSSWRKKKAEPAYLDVFEGLARYAAEITLVGQRYLGGRQLTRLEVSLVHLGQRVLASFEERETLNPLKEIYKTKAVHAGLGRDRNAFLMRYQQEVELLESRKQSV